MARASVCLALLATGCPEEEGDGPTERASVLTFNIGLAFGYVEEAPGRIDPITAAINASDADVVCLQEVWTRQEEGAWNTSVIDNLIAQTAGTFPESHWLRTTVPDDAPETGCEVEEADMLLGCAEPACAAEPPENLADCVLANCSEEFSATAPQCQNCMVSNLGQPLDDIVAACRGVTKGGIVYDGHNGLLVLSKHPLRDTDALELDYALTARSVLKATAELPGAGDTDIYCTHLASDLSASVAYPEEGTYTSFAEENLAQTDALVQYVEQTSSSERRVVAGDFNHGPGGGDVQAELQPSYDRMVAAGYADPLAELSPLPCTFCNANLLLDGQGSGGEAIDHVYLDETSGQTATASVVMQDPVEITGLSGEQRQVNLSDHFGLLVEF